MQTGPTILPASTLDVKLLQAILALFALKGTVKGAAIGAVLVLILALYSLVASALVEVTSSIADLWIHSDSIVKLLMLILAVYAIRKALPYILLLYKRGIL